MKASQLTSSDFNEYYGRYINKLPPDTYLLPGFKSGKNEVINFFRNIPESKLDYRYAPDKWSIKEVFQHVIDTERVFIYRSYRIGRGDSTPLAGFDQDLYIQPSSASTKTIEALLEEYEATRNFSISFLNSVTDQNLKFIGTASDTSMSSGAAAFIILGHEIWHMDVIREKYL